MSARSRTLIALFAGALVGFTSALTSDALAERHNEAVATVQPQSTLPWEEARLLAEVFERVKRNYVEDVDDGELMEKAIRGMIAALDPHSAFLDKQEFEEVRLSTSGAYPGVGIEIAAEEGAVKVLRTIEGSPAEQAGMQPGDLIVKVDGTDVGGDVAGAISRMRGPSGSPVKLTIRRPGTEGLIDFDLKRSRVEVHSVMHDTLEPGFGYLRITTFSETTPQDVERAIAKLQRATPGGLKGLVLDLRNNPGGQLEAGVEVADAFIENGLIVSADGRTPDARFRMDATPGDMTRGAELVVLVNSGSASASEIVAGALKDHGRATLVGHKTYGKGSVQTVMPLSRGGAVKLTTSRYYTPSGVSIHGKGIVPDVVVPGAERRPADVRSNAAEPLTARDNEVALALETLKSRIQLAQERDTRVASH